MTIYRASRKADYRRRGSPDRRSVPRSGHPGPTPKTVETAEEREKLISRRIAARYFGKFESKSEAEK
jgi:hypothetical protein